MRVLRVARSADKVDGVIPAMVPPAATAAIRRSQLPEWLRFRYEHSSIAFSTETAIRVALDEPVPMREIARACATERPAESIRDLDISAVVAIRARDVTVHGWGCEADDEDGAAGRICDCVLEQLPDELHVVVPTEVADQTLTPYEGMLLLRFWL